MALLKDVWGSFMALPLWVRFWVFGILVPVNSAAIFFVLQPGGWIVALLAIGGMMPNLVMLITMRGFSSGMSLSHVALWVPLVIYIWVSPLSDPEIGAAYRGFLWILLVTNLISLVFDLLDSLKWLRGERDVAR